MLPSQTPSFSIHKSCPLSSQGTARHQQPPACWTLKTYVGSPSPKPSLMSSFCRDVERSAGVSSTEQPVCWSVTCTPVPRSHLPGNLGCVHTVPSLCVRTPSHDSVNITHVRV